MSKKFFKVVTDCGHTVEYDTAYELGFIIGSKNMKMHNQYEPIHSECEEFNEGRFDGKKARMDGMTKRESGWYRIIRVGCTKPELAFFDKEYPWFCVTDSEMGIGEDSVSFVDPKMVMTPAGEIVYHNAEHNPAYNTKQEG